MKKTVIVDVVIVNSVMWAEGWQRGKRGKSQGWGSCYQTGDQGGWEFVTTSKKLALQVSKGLLLFRYHEDGSKKLNACNQVYLCMVYF
jgi:hypothetical protein